jgi:hypothetical protein
LGNSAYASILLGKGEGELLSAYHRRQGEAIAAYDNLILLFGNDTGAAVRAHIVSAFCGKRRALHLLGRTREAANVCDELVSRFGIDTDVQIRQKVTEE